MSVQLAQDGFRKLVGIVAKDDSFAGVTERHGNWFVYTLNFRKPS